MFLGYSARGNALCSFSSHYAGFEVKAVTSGVMFERIRKCIVLSFHNMRSVYVLWPGRGLSHATHCIQGEHSNHNAIETPIF